MSKCGRACDWIGPLAGRRTRREQDPRPHCDVRALAHIAVFSRGSSVVRRRTIRRKAALVPRPSASARQPTMRGHSASPVPPVPPGGLACLKPPHPCASKPPRDQSRVTPILCTLSPLPRAPTPHLLRKCKLAAPQLGACNEPPMGHQVPARGSDKYPEPPPRLGPARLSWRGHFSAPRLTAMATRRSPPPSLRDVHERECPIYWM
jgi:hypothetical protein